mgnify:CR=1 FL=1
MFECDMGNKRIYTSHDIKPSVPIRPGEILRDEHAARATSQRKFASLIGVSY